MQHRGNKLWIILIHLVGVTLFPGCIYENMEGCTRETEIFITVDNSVAQLQSLSESNEHVDNTNIYIYDADLKLERIVNYSRYDIENKTLVKVVYPQGCRPTVIVWGNLNGSQGVVGTDSGGPISSGMIRLTKNNEYFIPPDRLYYGYKELRGDPVEEVSISSWVGRINITVKGIVDLSDHPNDYYFTIESTYDGYDFHGNPVEGNALIKVDAKTEIRKGEELLCHEPINMIAYPPDDQNHTIKVNVYRKSITGDQLLGSAVSDIEGHNITTHPGKNTNVLLDFNQQSGMNVHIKITPWDHVFEWTVW